jgi:hypothetical protein
MQDVGTKVEDLSGQQLAGQHIYEYGAQGHHKGDRVIDVFESTGERHYFQGDLENNLRGTKSVEPVSDFMGRRGMQTPAMEVKDKGDVLSAEIASGQQKGEPLVQTTTEEQQEIVQGDLQESATETSTDTLQDKLLEKGEEKTQEIAQDKVKEALEKKDTGGTTAQKSGVRVRKACTTCFHYSNCSFCPKCSKLPQCCQCCQCCYSTSCCSQGCYSRTAGSQCRWPWSATSWSKHCC